jgi:hypothetical protein
MCDFLQNGWTDGFQTRSPVELHEHQFDSPTKLTTDRHEVIALTI